MTPHDDFRTLLAGLDAPADPDPLFRRRLRARFLAEAGGAAIGPAFGTEPEPIRRNRLLDLAAVAILLLSMIGGLVGLERGTIGSPTPTVQAATATPTQAPVQSVGSAARDNRYSGPAPDAAEYDLLWTAAADDYLPGGHVVLWEDRIYRYVWLEAGRQQPGFAAEDGRTGERIWAVPAAMDAMFAVTVNGIVLAVPDPEKADEFRIALLDHGTGDAIWTSGADFAGRDPALWSIQVSSGMAIVSGMDGQIVAIDLVTGETSWTYRAERIMPDGIGPTLCDAYVDICRDRTEEHPVIAILGETLYIADNLTVSVTAIDMTTGTERWRIGLGDLVPEGPDRTAVLSGPIAIDEGMVLMTRDLGDPLGGGGRLHLLDRTNGVAVWSIEVSVGSPIVVDNAGDLILNANPPDGADGPCCRIVRVDRATGDVEVVAHPEVGTMVEAFLSESNTLVYRTLEGPPEQLGMDLETGAILWSRTIGGSGCSYIHFPLPGSGMVGCLSDLGRVSVYAPGVETSTPEPLASPTGADG